MPVKKRRGKRRGELDDDTKAWLKGEQNNFTQFLPYEDLVAIWDEHGNSQIASWNRVENTCPTKIEDSHYSE